MSNRKLLAGCWFSIPALMIILIIISLVFGEKTTSLWTLLLWVCIAGFAQFVIYIQTGIIEDMRESLNRKDDLIDSVNALLKEDKRVFDELGNTIGKYLAGEEKVVWNVIFQSFDKTGSETSYIMNSFITQELAMKKFNEMFEIDNQNPEHDVEAEPYSSEYWYTDKKDQSLHRCLVLKSNIYSKI